MRHHVDAEILDMLQLARERLKEGARVSDVCKEVKISRATYFRWKQDYERHERMIKELIVLRQEKERLQRLADAFHLHGEVGCRPSANQQG